MPTTQSAVTPAVLDITDTDIGVRSRRDRKTGCTFGPSRKIMGRFRLQSPIMMYYQYHLRVGRFVGLWGVSRGCPLVISATNAPIHSGISQG